MQELGIYNHPDGDIMSLLQVLDLAESILQESKVTNIRNLPKRVKAQGSVRLFMWGNRICSIFLGFSLVTLVGKRFAHQRFTDSRESIRNKNLFLKFGQVRIASSLRFALTFA